MPQRTHIHPGKNGSLGPEASASSKKARAEQEERDTFGEDEVPTEPTRLHKVESDEFEGPVSQRSASRGQTGASSGEEDEDGEDGDRDEDEEDFEEDPFEDEGTAARRAGALATSAWDKSRHPDDNEPDTERQVGDSLPDAEWETPTLPDLGPFDKPGGRR